MAKELTFADNKVSIPTAYCSSCFAENPTHTYNVSDKHSEEITYIEGIHTNQFQVTSISLDFPLCENCYLDTLAISNYGEYAINNDPSYNKPRAFLANLFFGLASPLFLGGFFVIIQSMNSVKNFFTNNIVIYFVTLFSFVILGVFFNLTKYNRKNSKEIQAKAKSRYKVINFVKFTKNTLRLKIENDDYAKLVQSVNIISRIKDE
ncbi:MAG: hypothetical protein WCT77_08075 [Bacteroidota bacterium]|jgi:hypothetical protein